MIENKEVWYKKQTPLKQLVFLFFLNYFIWFFGLLFTDKFLLNEKNSLLYYLFETLITSIIMTVIFSWSIIKSLATKKNINSVN